jgi:hypothetical protein
VTQTGDAGETVTDHDDGQAGAPTISPPPLPPEPGTEPSLPPEPARAAGGDGATAGNWLDP